MNTFGKFKKGDVALIALTHFLHDLFTSILAPLLPLIKETLFIPYSLSGMLFSFQRLPSILNPIIGMLAHKVAIRYLLIVSPLISAFAMSLIGLANHYIILLLLLMLSGIGVAAYHVPAPVLMRKMAHDRVGLGMSIFMLGGEVARFIGPIFVTLVLITWGMEGTLLFLPLGFVASGILYFRFGGVKLAESVKKHEQKANIKASFKEHLPLFVKLGFFIFFMSLMKSALTNFLPMYRTSLGSSLFEGAVSLSIVQFAGAAGSMLSGTLSDKFGRRALLLISAVASPIAMWIFLSVDDTLKIPALLLFGFFIFAPTPVLLALVNEADDKNPAFVNGTFMTINFIIPAAAPILIGTMGDLIGLDVTYNIIATIGIIAVPAALILPIKKNA